MNKAWITGLTLAGVAGSAGAAFAGISTSDQSAPSVEAQGLPTETSTTTAAPHTATYQVGAAGTVTLTAADGALSVDSALPGAYWTLVGYGSPSTHVEVQFADAAQQVTFIADLANGEIVVSLSNVPAPGATTTSIEITPVTNAAAPAAPAPQAAAPAPKAIAVAVPGPAHTTSPSSATGSGGQYGSDDEGEHESEHESEHEEEGDDD
jgi:hypothetical protein